MKDVGVISSEGQRSSAPPRPPFAFSLGVTGHRSASLGLQAEAVATRIDQVVRTITEAAMELFAANADWFAQASPQLAFVSPLADGADQMAARSAMANGYALQAILPFSREQTRAEIAEDFRVEFDRMVESATSLLELPGGPSNLLEAYVMAGRATVAHSDLLMAVWDGEVPRGRGGTGEVVQLAIARGTPVVHVPIDAAQPITLIWGAYDPAVLTAHSDDIDRRPCDAKHVAALLDLLLAPPRDERERSYLATFCGERTRRFPARVEYPLLLATTGIARIAPMDLRARRDEARRQDEWQSYCEQCADSNHISLSLDLLGDMHGWADQLSTRSAQNYRSGHVLNFLLAAMAVLVGLAGFLLPGSRLELAVAEFGLAALILLNTRFGIRNEWHRRWIDYRQLAERLRPLRSLKLLGIAAPDPPGSPTNPVARRWVEWYAAAVWRAMGCPAGRITPDTVPALTESIAAHEVDPRVDYHLTLSRQVMMLDKRLERISAGFFWATLLVTAGTVAALAMLPDWINRWQDWLTLLLAGLPAIGGAIFGIRFQGDFGGSALRSDATAAALATQARELRSVGIGLMRAADLGEQAARAMFADLSQWRLVNQQNDPSINS